MKPSELSLFSESEQTVLVATEPSRLKGMSEDELDDLLMLVRRARNKYSKLHRRQGATTIQVAGTRAATASSNERTLRKAEIFEDALARVTRALGAAARQTRDELKRERLALAKGTATSPRRRRSSGSDDAAGAAGTRARGRGSGGRGHVPPKRAASTRARNARSQARRDRPR